MDLVTYHIAQPDLPLPPISAALYEYVLAANGVFLRGCRREFSAQFCIAPCDIRGLASLDSTFTLRTPRVPREFVEQMLFDALSAKTPAGVATEMVFHLNFDWESTVELGTSGKWQLEIPQQTQTPTRAKPDDDSAESSYARACIELHSHVEWPAQFSTLDDRDEVGMRIYAVLGRIFSQPELRVRVGCYGYHHEIAASEVFDLPPQIADGYVSEDEL